MPSKKVKDSDRRRCARACTNCKRRKERCDGHQPCQRCIDRGVRSDCKLCHQTRSPLMASTLPSPDPEIPDAGCLTGESENNVSSRHGGQSENAVAFPQLSRLVKDDRGTFMFIGDAANLSFLQSIRRIVRKQLGNCALVDDPLRHYMVEACPNRNHSLILDSGKDPPPRPTPEEVKYFVRWFQRATSGVLQLFDDSKLCEDVLEWLGQPQERLNAMSATYSLIFAIGAQSCPEERDEIAERHFNLGRYVTLATLMDDPSIATTQCHALIAMYLLISSRRNAAFMYLGIAVRGAYALGLHRKDVSALYDTAESMARERLWKGIRMLDLFMSASLGRPPATAETRNTSDKEHYSATTDLCFIFESILTGVYAKRMVTTEGLKRISELHRAWAARFVDGLKTDGIQPDDSLQTDEGVVPNIGLIHLKEAYYWTIMLLSRPFLIDFVSSSPPPTSPEGFLDTFSCSQPLSPSRNILVQACVDSAVRTIDLFHPLISTDLVPKRLPFVVNSAFAAALVIGLALFSGLDESMLLKRSLEDARKVLQKFSQHDAVTKRYLVIVDKLANACDAFLEIQQQRRMEYKGQLIGRLFGRLHGAIHGDASAKHGASSNSHDMMQWQGIWDQTTMPVTQPTPATGVSDDGRAMTANLEYESQENGRTTEPQQGRDNPTNHPQHMSVDVTNFFSPRTLWFDAYESSMLFPTLGSNMLEFTNLEGNTGDC